MGKKDNIQPENIKKSKKIFFYIVAFLIPVVLIVSLEASLRIFGYGRDLSLFIKSESYPGYNELNPVVAKRFFTKFKGTQISNDIFLTQKPDSAYRVFVMGCSTTRGFPYEMDVTFSRILYYRLQEAFPHKRIEVVNTAMAAVNSYTQADFIDEILAQKPDAILIYTGHNEYYGALGVGSVEGAGNVMWLKKLHLALVKFRLYQLVQNATSSFGKALVSEDKKPSGTLMERIAKDKAIAYGSEIYKDGIEQFALNMDKVVAKVKKAGVPIIISDIVSNISGNQPFKSIDVKGMPKASEEFEIARSYEKQGDYTKAREAYYLAKDLDGIRFRAPEEINSAIEKIAKKYEIPLLSMKKVFENASPNGIIGDNIMTEHLHPNVDGYFLMADAFFNAMRKYKFIAPQWDSTLIHPNIYYRNNWGFTELDSLVAHIKIESLKAGWPFKPDVGINRYIYTYVASSYIDSLAIACVRDNNNVFIEDMHKQLAQYYAKQGEYLKAFQEYNSLIKSYPYMGELYVKAVNYLLAAKDSAAAINYLMSCPDYKTDYLVCYKIGKIYQLNGQFEKAFQYDKMALQVAPKGENLEVIYTSLYRIYKHFNNTAESNKMLELIRTTNPGFFDKAAIKEAPTSEADVKSKKLVEEAIELARNEQFDKALNLLLESVKIKESAAAYRIIGSIYIKKNDPKAIVYFEKAYILEPLNENALHNLFLLTLRAGDYNSAGKYLEEFKAVSKNVELSNGFSSMLNQAIRSSK